MLTFREFINGLRKLELDPSAPLIVHAGLSGFGEVHGGAETVVGALSSTFKSLMMPVFTFKTMVIPESGPENNGITYGSGKDTNRMAEFFAPDLPADKMMGQVAEAFRKQSRVRRSAHPILSFAGINVDQALETQTLENPLGPFGWLAVAKGLVLLLGVGNTVNTSIHYTEHLAGRKQFVRWALTPQGVVECPGYPGCSDGFNVLDLHLDGVTHRARIGTGLAQAIPLVDLVEITKTCLAADPLMLLCERADCERCNAVRATLKK